MAIKTSILFLIIGGTMYVQNLAGTVILQNGNLIDVHTGSVRKVDVVIEDSIITQILPPFSAEIKDARRFNLTDKYIIPGLIDLSVYLGRSPGGNVHGEEFSEVTRERMLALFLLHGVTSVLDIGSVKEIEENLSTPHIYYTGPTFVGNGLKRKDFYQLESWNPYIFKDQFRVIDETTDSLLISLKQNGVKITRLILARDWYDDYSANLTLFRNFKERLKNHGLSAIAYVESEEDLKFAKEIGFTRIQGYVGDDNEIFYMPHIIYYKAPFLDVGELTLPEIIETTIALPFSYVNRLLITPEMKKRSANFIERFPEDINNNRRVVAGSNAGNPTIIPGHSLVWELSELVERGLSPLSALRAATVNAAEFLEIEKGSLKVGKIADIVVLRKNPLDKIENLNSVDFLFKAGTLCWLPSLMDKVYEEPVPLFPISPILADFERGELKTVWNTSVGENIYSFVYKADVEIVSPGADSRYCIRIRDKEGVADWERGTVIPLEEQGWIGVDVVSHYEGLRFMAKGEGRVVFLRREVRDYNYFQSSFGKERVWEEIVIPFEGLKDLYAIAFIPLGQELLLDDISFLPKSRREREEAILKSCEEIMHRGRNLGDLKKLHFARSQFERLYSADKNPCAGYLLALTNRSLFHLVRDEKKEERLLNQAIEILEELVERGDNSDHYALLASFYGKKIGRAPMLGMTLGRKIDHFYKRAEELDPANPRVFYHQGVSALFTPKRFGGGEDRAIKLLRKADALYREEPPKGWGHEETLFWIGRAFHNKGEREKAISYIRSALKIDRYYSHAWWWLISLGG